MLVRTIRRGETIQLEKDGETIKVDILNVNNGKIIVGVVASDEHKISFNKNRKEELHLYYKKKYQEKLINKKLDDPSSIN